MRHPEDPTDATDHDNCNCDQALALIETVKQLRSELETMVKERDEARREAEAMRRLASRLAYGGSLFGAVFQPSSFPWEKEE